MEERLLEIITHYSPESSLPLADGVLGFIQHQLVELVRDCLDKSQKGLVTSMYFAELQEKLEKLLHEVRKHSSEHYIDITIWTIEPFIRAPGCYEMILIQLGDVRPDS